MSQDKPKFSERIHNIFEKYGVSNKDVAVAALSLKGLSWATYFATLGLCYKYKPLKRMSKNPFMKSKLEYVEQNYPIYGRIKNFVIDKSQKMAKSKYFEPIPRRLGLKSKRFAVALTETIVVYKLMMPVLLPLQFWIVIQYFKRRNHNNVSEKD